MPRKAAQATAPLFPNTARAGLIFTDDGQIIYCSQQKNSIQRKGLSPETIASVFSHAPIWSGFLPMKTWCWGKANGAEWIALCLSASTQTLLIADDDKNERFTIPLPPLVFFGTRLEYSIWALGDETWTREPSAAAFHAPFPNVNDKGLVCFGTNILPPCSPQTIHDAWQLFLNSPFNNHQIANKSQQHIEDVRALWRNLSTQNSEHYPYQDLVPMGSSIGRVLEWTVTQNK